MSLSRWLVGSSRISSSQGLIKALAIATRFFSPSDIAEVFMSKSKKPSLVRMVFASKARASRACGSVFCSTMSSRDRFLSSTGFCSRQAMRMPEDMVIVPSSGAVCPAMMLSRVVLPVPLMPMMPILSLSLMYSDTLSRRTLPGKLLLILSNDSRIKLHLVLFGRTQYSITHGGM